jgi:hypothetical protein
MTAQAEREIGTPEESNVGHYVIIRSLLAVKDVLAIPESLLSAKAEACVTLRQQIHEL